MRAQKLDRKRVLVWRALFTLAMVTAAIYVLLMYGRTASDSLHAARSARLSWVAVTLLTTMCTFCIAGATYYTLALHPLRYTQTVLVEVASAFANRLLPAGLGGLGLNGVYLYHKGHTPVEATAVVSVNNLLGMCGHLLLLVGVLTFRPEVVRVLLTHHRGMVPWGFVAGTLLFAGAVLVAPPVRRKLVGFARNLLVSARHLTLSQLARALLLSVLLTASYTIVLYSAARSVGIDLGLVELFTIFSFGMLIGTAVPTPGGLVGAEAALFAGFIAYGISAVAAGAAVLLFRLATYWLPLIPGFVALVIARDRKLV
jgi:glycosyltransferase 2 family protein